MVHKSVIIYGIIIFYVVLTLFLGFYNFDNTTDTFVIGTFKFSNVILNISETPIWFSTIIFAPLALMILYYAVTSLAIFNSD